MPTKLVLLSLLVLTPLAWSMGNENSALVKTLFVGLCASAALVAVGSRESLRAFRRAVPVHAMLALSLLSAGFSPSPSFSWPAAMLVVTLWLVCGAATVPRSAVFWGRAVTLGAAIPVLHGLLQVAGCDPSPWGGIVRDHFHGRICSTLGNPNFYAAHLAGSLPFMAWMALTAARGRLALAGLTAGGLVALLLTGSKGGILGLAAAAAVFAVAATRGSIWRRLPAGALRWAVAGGIAAAAIGLVILPGTVRDRLLFNVQESVRFRALTWTQSLHMVRGSPVTGHGLGRFQVVYPSHRLPEIIRMFGQHSYMTDHPENLTLEIACELGLIGLGAWIWLLLAIGRALLVKLSAPDERERWMAAACAGSLSGLFVTNSFGVDIHYGATAALAACIAGAAFARNRAATRSGAPERIAAPTAVRLAIAVVIAGVWVHIYASDAALARALASSSRGEWSAAVPVYRQALRLNPANVMARYFHGSALVDRGEPEDLPAARRLLEGVRREAPDYVLLNHKLSLLYNRLGLTSLAEASLERQIRLDPLAAAFYLERGRMALEKKCWEEAKRDFETAMQVEPDNPSGYQYLGNLMVLRGRMRDALAVYARGLARSPGSEELNYNAAVAAFKLGDRTRARAYAESVLRVNPGHAQARLILARLE